MSDLYFLPEARDLLARIGPANALVLLEGELGAGKTTFAKTLLSLRGLAPADVQSPTFLKVIEHRLPAGGRALHLDLYRVDDAEGVEKLGLEAYEDVRLWIVEWPAPLLEWLRQNSALPKRLGIEKLYRVALELDAASGVRSLRVNEAELPS